LPDDGAALDALAEHFAHTTVFDDSPLYRILVRTAAARPDVLKLVASTRPGQQPSFLLFGAVHYLLLSGVRHPLRSYYASVVGRESARPAHEDAAEMFVDFCSTHAVEIRELTSRRLVQTNSVRRSLALWLAMSRIASLTAGPVHLIEIGASAGLNLLFNRYAYQVGDRVFGDTQSRARVVAELRGTTSLGHVSTVPVVASRQGVDLNPLDLHDPDDRQWLRALVWPDEVERRELLDAAIAIASTDVPRVRELDVTTLEAPIDLGLPEGEVRVLFHSATRMHVPVALHERFDRGVDLLGAGGPAYVITMEPTEWSASGVLRVRRPDGTDHAVAELDGHVTWIKPVGGDLGDVGMSSTRD
jgi:hypothetical protein